MPYQDQDSKRLAFRLILILNGITYIRQSKTGVVGLLILSTMFVMSMVDGVQTPKTEDGLGLSIQKRWSY
jgi:hypothetical protein